MAILPWANLQATTNGLVNSYFAVSPDLVVKKSSRQKSELTTYFRFMIVIANNIIEIFYKPEPAK
jgi:uncharacterized protein with HEPN domain